MFGMGKKQESKAKKGGEPQDYFDEALDWEASKVLQASKSEARAWRYTKLLGALLVLSIASNVLMMPLKEKVPYLIRVDKNTGFTDTLTVLSSRGVGYEDVQDKYWVGRYVLAREAYDWYSLQEDYETVGLLSTTAVGREYGAIYQGPNARDKKLGASMRRKVKILSVVPSGRGTATVRFRTETGPTDGSSPPAVELWVATVSYEYRSPSAMREQDRYINPLGFQVTSYRVDAEAIAPASQGVQAPMAEAAQ